ncbi:hypothetical protein HN51_041104 [Arachis hypogaea]
MPRFSSSKDGPNVKIRSIGMGRWELPVALQRLFGPTLVNEAIGVAREGFGMEHQRFIPDEDIGLYEVAKKIDDIVWLRHLEDPLAPPYSSLPWPQPWYPGVSASSTFISIQQPHLF